MKRIIKINISVLGLCVFALLCFGLLKKQSYSSLFASKDSLFSTGVFDEFGVGLASENMTASMIKLWKKELESESYILKLEIISEPEVSPYSYGYRAIVRKVFKGDISEGSEIFLKNDGWSTFLNAKELMLPVDHAININFVNFLKKNHNYLVFINRKLETPLRENVYTIKGYSITPAFDYEETRSMPGKSISDSVSTVLYKDVKGNEFISDSERAIELFYEFKESIIKKYPV